MSFEQILKEQDGGVVTITIDHPPLNVLSAQVGRELGEALDQIDDDPDASVVILTGSGDRAFAAGADIRELQRLSGSDAEEMTHRWHRLFRRIEGFRLPVIAAVNGVALGGGCELAMACDLRYASEKARFGQPEINLGLVPGWGGTQRLPRLIGRGRALELMLTGDMFDAAEAHRLGLVNRVTAPEDLMETVGELAGRMAAKGGVALASIKTCVNEGLDLGLDDALALEAREFGAVSSSEDKAEGIAAFLEKRPAAFRGR
ncbi:MAG: enoyl-CoA hydratase-related protein [candidate division Zixibacteria bacterium]|nr:enoyl-CoA hydratase-related protein [candidate division Zixibacteria bacterium]